MAEERRTPEDIARAEFAAADIELVGSFLDTKTPIEGICGKCGRKVSPTLGSIRSGQGGCKSCSSFFYSRGSIERHQELARSEAYLYVVEFDDHDGAIFRKFGIGRHGTTVDRLEGHMRIGGRLISVENESLLVCVVAEQGIKKAVGKWAYKPAVGRLNGGSTECFHPAVSVDLKQWLAWARLELAAPLADNF
ncbi:hypothetical protein ACTMSW_13350 [Micromonospora sp. BQ11]|uniref:hypothetical protein n=1 Tax=Micromonospora sp. BQ11 TaxID=3452212 RepID=UPI003F8C36D7